MGQAAAIFDLDRTLLAGSSGPVFSEAMRQAGIMGERSMPGERLLFKLFDVVGETLPSMALARQGASLAKGRCYWRAGSKTRSCRQCLAMATAM